MTLGRKAELLGRILGHVGIASEFGALKVRLDELVRIRNACAHWRGAPNFEFDATDPTGHRLSFTTLAKSGRRGKDEVRFYPHRFVWLVEALHDDLYAVQRRLDQMWASMLLDYQPTWTPDLSHDRTDLGPPPH